MVSHCWLLVSAHLFLCMTLDLNTCHARENNIYAQTPLSATSSSDRAGRNGSSLEVDLIGLFRPIDLKIVTTVLVKVKRSTTNMKGGVQESNGENITYFYQLTREVV